ncbi:MAG: citramalate synthase [Nitrososphaeria archaeon]
MCKANDESQSLLLSSKPTEVEILDSTLREGSQARGVSFTLNSKIKVALELDKIGVHIIELGWPGSNPKDIELFKAIKKYKLENSKTAAFTSTKRKGIAADKDPSLNAVLDSDSDLVVVFGKSWKQQCKTVLKLSPEENLNMISETITFFRKHGLDVIYDAEHFFDGYLEDPEYAIQTIKTADRCGASRVVLADTNGGMLPHQIVVVVRKIFNIVKKPLGAHMHNDSGNAVANTLMAVLSGVIHVQVTVNGVGERVGNADLCQVLPNLELKLGIRALKSKLPIEQRLRGLFNLSNIVYEASGISRNPYQPYVGLYAFTHKAGVHVDAITKDCRTYEHVSPELVGNKREITVSDLSGRSTIVKKIAEELGVPLGKQQELVGSILNDIKEMGLKDLELDNAEATVYLILLKNLNLYREFFKVSEWMSVAEGSADSSRAYGLTRVNVKGKIQVEGSEGVGPVNAIDIALRKTLLKNYPELKNVKLIDYKVVLPEISRDTASIVRVLIEFTDGNSIWRTTATSKNVVEASISALVQGLDYYLQKSRSKNNDKLNPREDFYSIAKDFKFR